MGPLSPVDPQALAQAARNLLCGCAGFAPGDDLLICREDARHGWYDAAAAEAVAVEALRLGLRVEMRETPPPGEAPQPWLEEAISAGANIVYFARVGDHDRFGAAGRSGRRVMVYARNAADLASEFGRTDYAAMAALKQAVDAEIAAARRIVITCPQGTRIEGRVSATPGAPPDVTVQRFPLGIPAPVPASGFTGRVALHGALTPTGNRAYEPAVLPLGAPVMARIDGGRIEGFEGDAAEVARIEAHYRAVAGRFGLSPFHVHSWHAGVHPGCPFFEHDLANSDYWSNTVFSSPRLLHFHTCGQDAPGEITWNLIDPTVTLDGAPLWKQGRLLPLAFPRLAACLEVHPSLRALF